MDKNEVLPLCHLPEPQSRRFLDLLELSSMQGNAETERTLWNVLAQLGVEVKP